MNAMPLEHTNGSAHGMKSWLQSSVHTFFSGFNWDDIQFQIPDSPTPSHAVPLGDGPLSLAMSVSQFFGLIPWEGVRAIAAPAFVEEPIVEPAEAEEFTLDDFSGLF